MAGVLSVTIEYDGILAMKQSDLNRVVRESMEWIGKYWRQHILPRHFTHQGATKYNYALRAGERGTGRKFRHSYTGKKLDRYGHTLPLVYTGEGRREALTDQRVIGKATAKMASVSIPLPRKYNLRRPGSPVNMADEIRAVSPEEIGILENELVKMLELKLRTHGQLNYATSGVRVHIAG
ncbi:hypothetical protein EH220_03035 [bacterium]|nr:MAG: hypothetical protein EH220_03035 [bacterium]